MSKTSSNSCLDFRPTFPSNGAVTRSATQCHNPGVQAQPHRMQEPELRAGPLVPSLPQPEAPLTATRPPRDLASPSCSPRARRAPGCLEIHQLIELGFGESRPLPGNIFRRHIRAPIAMVVESLDGCAAPAADEDAKLTCSSPRSRVPQRIRSQMTSLAEWCAVS